MNFMQLIKKIFLKNTEINTNDYQQRAVNYIEEQILILDELYHIVKGSCPPEATSAQCTFKYYHDSNDNSYGIKKTFSYNIKNENISTWLDEELSENVVDLVYKLHTIMKEHTGEDWNEFTLFIEENGKARNKFKYSMNKGLT